MEMHMLTRRCPAMRCTLLLDSLGAARVGRLRPKLRDLATAEQAALHAHPWVSRLAETLGLEQLLRHHQKWFCHAQEASANASVSDMIAEWHLLLW